MRLGVELGRKLERTQIAPGQGAEPLFRLGVRRMAGAISSARLIERRLPIPGITMTAVTRTG